MRKHKGFIYLLFLVFTACNNQSTTVKEVGDHTVTTPTVEEDNKRQTLEKEYHDIARHLKEMDQDPKRMELHENMAKLDTLISSEMDKDKNIALRTQKMELRIELREYDKSSGRTELFNEQKEIVEQIKSL